MSYNDRALRCWDIWKSSARNRSPIEKLMIKITKKAKLKIVCPNKWHIELQMLIVIPSAPILQNPMLCVRIYFTSIVCNVTIPVKSFICKVYIPLLSISPIFSSGFSISIISEGTAIEISSPLQNAEIIIG